MVHPTLDQASGRSRPGANGMPGRRQPRSMVRRARMAGQRLGGPTSRSQGALASRVGRGVVLPTQSQGLICAEHSVSRTQALSGMPLSRQ